MEGLDATLEKQRPARRLREVAASSYAGGEGRTRIPTRSLASSYSTEASIVAAWAGSGCLPGRREAPVTRGWALKSSSCMRGSCQHLGAPSRQGEAEGTWGGRGNSVCG